jgi:hypothetical protein
MEEYDSPPPPQCCQKRLWLLEYGILLSIQLACFLVDIGIWITGAYSVIAAFCLIFILHCLILLPAIFLPLVIDKCGMWLKRLRDWKVFHKYDWNIAISTVTIISTVVSLLLVLFCQPLFFKWTHETTVVPADPSYHKMRAYSSFKFDANYHLNITMMGEKISYPVGDPNGAGVYYNCFAPIILNMTAGPNLFWAVCPWQKLSCAASLQERSSCVWKWHTAFREGIAWTRDIEYLVHDAIEEQSRLWKLPASPPQFITIHWENAEQSYRQALTVFWITLLIGNILIIFWWILRRPFLRCFCSPPQANDYAIVN